MNHLIGVMQGRLVPKFLGRYQAHPINYWKDEFAIAKDSGLDCIEFILDYSDAHLNPLLKKYGVDEILSISEKTGIVTTTVCADYFMAAPLHSLDESVANQSIKILRELLVSSERLGITDIIIPCVDQSSLSSFEAVGRLVNKVRPMLDIAGKAGINLNLETDLGPHDFFELLEKFDSKHVTVNYDIGNSAAMGFDSIEELDAYGDRITDIHIKDRTLNGSSVILGQGNANFELFFQKLKEFNYKGPFIMQAYRDDEGVEVFKRQLKWIRPYLDQFSS
jgi:L-ribulose-5-phosphate 3-epimerase